MKKAAPRKKKGGAKTSSFLKVTGDNSMGGLGTYDHKSIEKKWQGYWEKTKLFLADDAAKKKKFYGLIEFPYPSGDGLHVGHIRSNTAMDAIARKRRMEGYNVLYPIGWDAFGLPTENYAIKTGIQPAIVTKKNTDIFRRQLKSLGFSFDWSREIDTTDPAYYKWTQWIFLKFLEKGLAYKKRMAINWCPKDLIGLANEEVIDGKCERCGTPVEKKEKEQWMLAITKYADRLDRDLDEVDFLERIKIQQRNWIGKSEGAEIEFPLVLKREKPRFVLIHGYKGSAQRNFFPWLKRELESRGYEVECPELPDPENPKESEQVDHVIKTCRFDDKTVIIGHSLGCVVAQKVLMKLGKPISGLVLVASAIDPAFGAPKVRSYHKTFEWNHDYELLKRLCKSGIAVLSDAKEPKRAPYLKYLADKLGALLIETTGVDEHFCAKEEPEILKAVTPLVKVFTTRPDTLFGATYVVLAPEHYFVNELLARLENRAEVENYLNEARKKSATDRADQEKEKTGVELKGVKAINPANGEEIPVWVADYVLSDYGTGAVMAVPAHDGRDFEFAKRHSLPIREVVAPLIHVTQGEFAFRPEKKTVERKSILAIVKHWEKDEYLCLTSEKHGWTTFVIGGVENDEDIVEAAKREIAEETGYTDIKSFQHLGGDVYAKHFAPHKDENRFAKLNGLYFELGSGTQSTVADHESDHQKVEWVKKEDVPKRLYPKITDWVFWQRLLEFPRVYEGDGFLVNSGKFDGKDSKEAKKEITDSAGGKWVTTYKLRDWVFSRQRYWGEPIPVVHCAKCGAVPVPEKDLPVKLPPVKNYKPTATGESPLAAIEKWVNTTCPTCKGKAKRETDTMPNWAGSSWYYLRYADPRNKKAFADKKKLKHWTPVDWYNGGMEHTTLHLLYSRFWHKFLFDLGLVPTNEPYSKRTSHGLILAEGGVKMSKSKGNVINPDDIVERVGADSLRLYEMFMGPFDQPIAWDVNGIAGTRRFIERVWKLREKIGNNKLETLNSEQIQKAKDEMQNRESRIIHKTIKKVSGDIEAMRFNTAVSALMIALNELEKIEAVSVEAYGTFVKLLSPFSPHIAEELWSSLGNRPSIGLAPWPVHDPSLAADAVVTIMVQINGKVRGSFEADAGSSMEMLERGARGAHGIQKWLEGKTVKKVIVIPDKLVNIVAG